MDWKASPSKLSIPSIFQKSPTSNVTQEKTSVSRNTSSVDRPIKQETASSISKSTGSLFKRAENNQAPVKQTLNKNITENNDADLQRKTSLIRKSNPSLSVAASPIDLKKDGASEIQRKKSSGLRPVSALYVAGNSEDAKKNDNSELQRKLSTGLKPISFAFSIAANSVDPKTIDKKSENTSLKSSFSKSLSNLSTDRTSTDGKISPVSPSAKFTMAALAPNSKPSSNSASEKKSSSPTVVRSIMKSAENFLQTIKSKRESSDKLTTPSLPNIKTLAAQFSSTPINKEIKSEESYQRNVSPVPSINRSFSRQTSVSSNSGKEEKLSLPIEEKTVILPSSPFSKQNSISSNSDHEEKSPIPFQIKTLSSPSSPFTKSFPKQNSMFSASEQEEKSPKTRSTYSPINNSSNSIDADISGLSLLSPPKHQEKDTDVVVRRILKSPQSGDQSSTICFNFAKKNSTSTPDISKTDTNTTKRESVELFGDRSSIKLSTNRTVVYAENKQVNKEKIKATDKTAESEKTNLKMDTDNEIKKANVKISENETHRKDNINIKNDTIKSKEQTSEINTAKNINNEHVISDMKSLNQDKQNKIMINDKQIELQEEITVTKKRTRAQTEICDEILNTIATRLNQEANKENSVVNESVSVAEKGSVNKYCDDEKIYENIDVIRQHIAKKSRNDVPVGKCPVPSVRINYLKLRRRTVFF